MKGAIMKNVKPGMKLLSLILCACLLAVFMFEGALWLFHIAPYPEAVYNILERDEENGFRFKSNGVSSRSSWEYDTPVVTNSIGIRDTEDVNSESVTEIFLLGDSFAEGHGVNLEDTIAKQLQRVTGKKVANLGLASTGTIQQVNIFRRYIRVFKRKPKYALLLFYVGNDYYDNRRFFDTVATQGRSHQVVSNGYLVDNDGSSVVQDGKWMLRKDKGGRIVERKLHPGFALPPGFDNKYLNWSKLYASYSWLGAVRGKNCQVATPGLFGEGKYDFNGSSEWKITKDALGNFISVARAHSIEPIIAIMPSKFQLDRSLLLKAGCSINNFDPDTSIRVLVEYARSEHVPAINLSERFNLNSDDFDRLYYKVDVHLTPYGNRVAAGFIADALR